MHEPVTPTVDRVSPAAPARSQARQFVGMLVIAAATAQSLGYTLKVPSMLEVNDISRWCTVWALLEQGTYVIDECPWRNRTQDRVYRPAKLLPPGEGASALKRLEYALAPESRKEAGADIAEVDREHHYYSSKPPLLPTIIAGILYPFRNASGVELGRVSETPKMPERNVEVPVEGQPGKFRQEVERDRGTVKWPVHVYYFKPIILLLNVVPYFAYLVLLARFLDRHAENDWAWFFSLVAAAWGTYLLAFNQTLNNHTVAAYSAFFAIYALIRIVNDGERGRGYFAAAGFWGAFAACNEIPAALFGMLLFLTLVARFPKKTLLAFVPAAAVPLVAFFVTQFLAFGQFTPVYEEFGTKSYEFQGSYWQTPLEFDYLNKYPEPYGVYLFHMTLGHHGVFSLTPIFLFSIWGILANLVGRGRKLPTTAWLTLTLTAAMLAFYTWNPKARNYGGSTQGLRWLFWLIPLWVVMLPLGVKAGQDRRWVRWLALAALAVSVLSVGYGMRMPWSHPWIVDAMERAGHYELKR